MNLSEKFNTPPTWVIKPRDSCCGKGIQIVQSLTEVKDFKQFSVAQIYVEPFFDWTKKI